MNKILTDASNYRSEAHRRAVAHELSAEWHRKWGVRLGVAATALWGADDPYYHSIHDTIDKVNPNSLKALGDTIAIVAWRLANQ